MAAKKNYFKCINCGNLHFRYVTNAKGRNIVICKQCGLGTVNPIPDKKKIIGVVNKVSQHFYDEYLTESVSYKEYFSKKLDEISTYKIKGDLLEIGCGPGLFLSLAKQKGWNVTGVELSHEAVSINKKNGINVIYGTLDSLKIKNKYDVICAFQLIEHVPDPKSLLIKINHLLKRDGVLMVVTPNRRAMSAMVMGRYWYDYYNEEHLYFFTMPSLLEIFSKSGFEIIFKNKEISRSIDIYYQYKRLLNYSFTPDTVLYKYLYKISPIIKLLSKFIKLREPCVNLNVIAGKSSK